MFEPDASKPTADDALLPVLASFPIVSLLVGRQEPLSISLLLTFTPSSFSMFRTEAGGPLGHPGTFYFACDRAVQHGE